MKDKEIIDKIQIDKELHYFDALYKKYYPKVRKIIYYRIRNDIDSDDITSNIFKKIFEELKNARFRGEARFSTWLYTITKNECNIYYRQNKKLLEKEEYTEKEEFERKISGTYQSAEQEILLKEDAERKEEFLSGIEDIDKRRILREKFESRTFDDLKFFYDSISHLNKKYQRIVFLFLDGNSLKETAEILGIKMNNLYKKFYEIKVLLEKISRNK